MDASSGESDGWWLAAEGSFARFAPAIRLLSEGTLTREALCAPPFLLHDDGRVTIVYAPLDHINREARVALVGITPGWGQTQIAFEVAARGLRDGVAPKRILQEVKQAASFAGTMRDILVQMLDGIGLADRLGLHSCDLLFTPEHGRLLHSTSVLHYPVFVAGRNYTGHEPKVVRYAILREMAVRMLVPELAAVPNALIIPLGVAVQRALRFLVGEGLLDEARCLFGFPHPSRANGHRARQYAAHREALAAQVDDWFTRRRNLPF